MHNRQSVQRIFFVPDTFPGWDAQVHPVGSLVIYKRQHPQTKSGDLPSKLGFSLHSKKNISYADFSTLCAFWQQTTQKEHEHGHMPDIHHRHEDEE